jgi:signal transduction histidine kinase
VSLVARIERSPLSAVFLAVIGGGLGAGFILHFTVYHPLGTAPFWQEAAELVFALLPVGAMLGASYWLFWADLRPRWKWRIALWSASGLGAIALVTLLTLGHQQITGGDPSRIAFYLSGNASIGATAGLLVGLYDVQSRQKETELETVRDTFALANRLIRHDVLNAVSIIDGYADRLQGEDPDPEAAATIVEQAERIVTLIENVRALEEVADEDDGNRHSIALRETIEEHVDAVASAYPEARFDVEVPADLTVQAEEAIGTVFENVLVNAVKHNDQEQPRVTVTADAADDAVTIRIADNGPGIPSAQREAVFEAERMEAGGLGLFLVKTLVEYYGGHVHVEENDPRGTVVVIRLPRPPEPRATLDATVATPTR